MKNRGSNLTNSIHTGSIARIWHGWAKKEKADAFEKILTGEAIPDIEKNPPPGYLGIQVMRNELGNEVEFTTIMWFNSLSGVMQFAGQDYETAHIDSRVRPLLLRFDKKVIHTHVVHSSF